LFIGRRRLELPKASLTNGKKSAQDERGWGRRRPGTPKQDVEGRRA
jgi:hypothetical protein